MLLQIHVRGIVAPFVLVNDGDVALDLFVKAPGSGVSLSIFDASGGDVPFIIVDLVRAREDIDYCQERIKQLADSGFHKVDTIGWLWDELHIITELIDQGEL